MSDAQYFRLVAKRSRLTVAISRVYKLPLASQIAIAVNKENPMLYRVAALRCIVWDSRIGLGQCYLQKRRLVRSALGI